LVHHSHFTVNGKKVNIPSYLVKVNDVISIREKSRDSEKIKMLVENISDRSVPAWLDVSKDTASATVVAIPTRADVEFPFEEHLIVELYSK
jgi:small subunit ribosomal protein S4